MNTVGYIIAMVICVIFSAYFSATETAFSTINKTRIKTLAEKGNKSAKLVLTLSEDYDRLISTILIGNNIVNIALASLGTLFFVYYFPKSGASISTAVITVVVLIFGEVSPKSIAKDFPERFAMFAAPLIRLLIWVLLPFNALFSLWKKLLSRIFKTSDDSKMSQEELLMLVEEVEQDGSINEDEGSLLRNVIEFTDLTVEEILTRRVDLEGVDANDSREEVAARFSKTKFSRLLVYEEDVDHVVGVLHQKDFYTETGLSERPLRELMTPPLFVPQSTKLSDLLKLLQTHQSHVAVVVDEYGETLGIVTMEDILEELVGEIWDEHDEVVESFRKLGESAYRVECDTPLHDFCDFFEVEIESESVTVNGWVVEQLAKLAEKGDSFTYKNLSVTVVETDAHRATDINVVVSPVREDDKDSKEE